MTKGSGLPEEPRLGGIPPEGQEEELEDAPIPEPAPTTLHPTTPERGPAILVAPDPSGRYWTEDRILRMVMAGAFLIVAGGLVISLAFWPVLSGVPWLPWAVGAAILSGPAWRAYTELAEESKARRIVADQRAHGMGIDINPPSDRSKG